MRYLSTIVIVIVLKLYYHPALVDTWLVCECCVVLNFQENIQIQCGYICDRLCKNPPYLRGNFDLFLQFQNAITLGYHSRNFSIMQYRNFLALFWYKEIKNMLHYQYFTAVFVKMHKIREHGRFLQSQSHIVHAMIN